MIHLEEEAQMAQHELAQLNIGTMLAPIDSPVMKEFVDNLDRINALAERSPGFVWRLKDDDGDATAIRPFGEEILVNMSVWKDVESLHEYVYKTAHAEIMRRRKEWFSRMKDPFTVLWWVPAGHRPTTDEAKQRLDLLRAEGPSPDAFTFREAFDPPGSEFAPRQLDGICPA